MLYERHGAPLGCWAVRCGPLCCWGHGGARLPGPRVLQGECTYPTCSHTPAIYLLLTEALETVCWEQRPSLLLPSLSPLAFQQACRERR